jgi:hypothetical protein
VRAILACVQCGAECGMTWCPARGPAGAWLCDGCGLARFADLAVGTDPALVAVETTGPIALPPVAAPVVADEPAGTLKAPWLKEAEPCAS